MKKILEILMLFFLSISLSAVSGASKDRNNDGEPDQWYEFQQTGMKL